MALPRTVSGLRRYEAIIQLKLKAGLPLSEEQKAYLNSAVSREELEEMERQKVETFEDIPGYENVVIHKGNV